MLNNMYIFVKYNDNINSINMKKACYNCEFSSSQFKVLDKTHVHCQNETMYPQKGFESGELTAWDTLRSWYDSCNYHKAKKK